MNHTRPSRCIPLAIALTGLVAAAAACSPSPGPGSGGEQQPSNASTSTPPSLPSPSPEAPTASTPDNPSPSPTPTDAGSAVADATAPVDSSTSRTDAAAGDASGSAGFTGMYSCSASFSASITSPFPDMIAESPTATLDITETGTTLTAALTAETDAGPLLTCTFTFQDDGNGSASLDPPGQTCTTTLDGIPLTITVSSGGDATLSGSSLDVSNIDVTIANNGGAITVAGTATLSANCTK
jgi:hypothetical protein